MLNTSASVVPCLRRCGFAQAGLHSLRPFRTAFLSILREAIPLASGMETIKILTRKNSLSEACERSISPTGHTRALTGFFTIWH